jgi:hypothetical protein
LAAERIDAPDAPTGGTPDVDLAFKTEASAVCNTPGVYIPLDNEYGYKHVRSVNKTDRKV